MYEIWTFSKGYLDLLDTAESLRVAKSKAIELSRTQEPYVVITIKDQQPLQNNDIVCYLHGRRYYPE